VVDYGHRPAAVPGLTGECVSVLLSHIQWSYSYD
jgi:hypothetical protein